jgi:hypothetical protein
MNELRDRLRKINEEHQRQNLQGYSADPYSRHRLANEPRWEGPPIQGGGAKVPHSLVIEQVDGKWWGNKPAFGPFDTVRDLEMAVFGSSALSGGRRDFRDDPPPKEMRDER